jgi:hypothetical protein
MATLLIELHAFNRHYIRSDSMPFLSEWADRFGLGELIPPFGYDALTSLWTGVWPDRHGHFAKYSYSGSRRSGMLSKIPSNAIASAVFNLGRIARGEDFLTRLARDPRSRYFDVERRFHYPHLNAFAVPTFFDYLRQAKRSFIFFEWPLISQSNRKNRYRFAGSNDADRVRYFHRIRLDQSVDFYFLMLKDLDTLGHRYGPFSPEVTLACQRLDNLLRDLLSDFSPDDDQILLLSSYGMLPVTHQIDLSNILPPFGQDYLYFLDSTMARFWFWDDRARQNVENILRQIKGGRIISDGELQQRHAFFPDHRFGEIIFMVEPGMIIAPDFYRGAPARGMHTYDLTNINGHEFGVVICNRPIESSLRSIDVLPTLAEFMHIPLRSDLDGHSVTR